MDHDSSLGVCTDSQSQAGVKRGIVCCIYYWTIRPRCGTLYVVKKQEQVMLMTAKSFAENRCYPRLLINLTLNYKYLEYGNLYHALESRTLNLSACGLAMYTDRILPKDQHILMTLFLPRENVVANPGEKTKKTDDNYLSVMLLSSVVWCHQDENDECHVGLKIMQVEPEHKKRLQLFLASHKLD